MLEENIVRDLLREPAGKKITITEVFKKIWDAVQRISDLQGAVAKMEYGIWTIDNTPLTKGMKDSAKVHCLIYTDKNQYAHVDCYLDDAADGQVYVLGTIKSRDNGLDAYAMSGQLAGAFTYLVNQYLNINWDMFK